MTTPTTRSPFRYSLRFLLAGMTLLCIGLACSAWYWRRAQRQAAAVKYLESGMDVRIEYDYECGGLIEQEGDGAVFRELTATAEPKDIGLGRDFWHSVLRLSMYIRERNCDEIFSAVRQLPNLRDLSLYVDDGVEPRHLRQIQADHLEILEWHGPLNEIQLAEIGRWTNLRSIEFGCDLDHITDFSPLERLQRLRELNIELPTGSDGLLLALSEIKGLRKLKVGGATITDRGAASIAKLRDLRHIFVSGEISSEGVKDWDKLTELRSFSMSTTQPNPRIIDIAAKLPKLQDAYLWDAVGHGDAFGEPGAGTELKHLSLCVDQLTAKAWQGLARLPKLQKFEIFGDPDNDAIDPTASGFRTLTDFRWQGFQMTPELWQWIGHFPEVTDLEIICKEGVSAIATSPGPPKLAQLRLKRFQLTRQELLKLLELNPNLKSLYLGDMELSEGDLHTTSPPPTTSPGCHPEHGTENTQSYPDGEP